jgi:hypothetical protein
MGIPPDFHFTLKSAFSPSTTQMTLSLKNWGATGRQNVTGVEDGESAHL